MAYQPKSYKKFVATAATATLVATAVAPTALAADFTDVSSNYKVAVDYLVDQGIAQGLTETTFGVTSPIKRGDAAVMIAKALGLDTVNAPDQGFTDLNDRVAGAVNAIVEAEIASGKTETTFAPDLYITRQEMAKVIANAYGLTGENTENTFSDVNDNWDEYVDALVEAGITKGYEDGTFGATDDVTRGQFALFIYRAEGQPLPVPAVSDLAFNEEGDQFTLTFAEGLPEGADLNFVLENYAITINGEPITEAQVEALALEVASVSDNRMVFDVSHTDLDELADALGGDEVTLSIGGKAATYTFDTEAPAPGTPEVVSAMALNLKQVEVKFNTTELTEEDVEDGDFYTFLTANGTEVEVDNVMLDGDTAVVTFTDAVSNQAKLDLTVDMDAFGGTEDFTAKVEFFDVTIPEVVSAEAVGSRTVKVTFSEPLDVDDSTDAALRAAFELNDGSQFVRNVTFMNNNTVANVEFYTDLEEGENTISVSDDLEDYAGYNVVATELDFVVVEDNDAPTIVEVKNVSPTSATLVFNEDLVDDLTAADFYHTNTNEKAASAVLVDGNEVKLTFAAGDELPNGTAYIYVAKEAVVDLWGNANDQQLRVEATVVADETAPSVQKVEATAQNVVEVTFSEDVDRATAEFTLLDADGEELDIIDTVNYKVVDGDAVNDTLVITLDENIYGEHTLVVEDVEDLVGNALTSEEVEFFVEDETAPVFTDFAATLYNDDATTELLVIDFDEPMAVTGQYSVLDKSKYIVNGVALSTVDSAKLTAIDGNSKVQIEYRSTELNVSVEDDIQIGRVADAAGNFTKALAGTVDVEGAGTVEAKSVNVVANNRIVVTLDDLVTDFEASEFEFSAGEDELTPIGASINNSGTTSVLTFTFGANTFSDNGTVDGVAVDVIANGVETVNQYGEAVEFEETAADKISGKVEDLNPSPSVYNPDVTVSFVDADFDGLVDESETATFYVNYTEAVRANTLSALSYEIDGFTVASVTVDTDTSVVAITATADADNTDYMTEVSQVLNITDVNGNVIATGSYDVEGQTSTSATANEVAETVRTVNAANGEGNLSQALTTVATEEGNTAYTSLSNDAKETVAKIFANDRGAGVAAGVANQATYDTYPEIDALLTDALTDYTALMSAINNATTLVDMETALQNLADEEVNFQRVMNGDTSYSFTVTSAQAQEILDDNGTYDSLQDIITVLQSAGL